MKCQIFYCEYIKDRFCCAHCGHRHRCSNPCLNGPERCGQAVDEATGKAKTHIKAKMPED